MKELWESIKGGWKRGSRLGSTIPLMPKSTIRTGFRSPFVTEAERERRETRELHEEVKRLYEASPYVGSEAANTFIYEIVVEACDRAGVVPTIPLGEALFETVRGLLATEGSIYGFPEVDFAGEMTLEEGVALRSYLHRKRRFLSDHERLLAIWREKLLWLFSGILGCMPSSLFGDPDEADSLVPEFSAPLIDLCEAPAEVIERTMATFYDEDVTNARLFDPIRERLDRNALVASRIPPERQHQSTRTITPPTAARGKSNAELVESYLAGTPLAELFSTQFPFMIPFPVRFEHTLVVGGTGHGKTQLMQLSICRDLEKSADEDGRSIVVIDSQGDLIRTISHTALFAPDEEWSLADRLLLIDPNDVEYPVCLNMFDWNRDRMARYGPADREKILNGTVELYEYLFGALLGAELTQRQGLIFKYLARLMMEIPGATIQTLRELMEDGEPFRPYMEKLPGTARRFFETRFFDRSFNETKKQILTRLWGVLSNPTFERMFSHPKNKVDLFEATNSGKIILINTAKDLLKQEGCSIFGRFFIALLSQAALERATLPPHERRSTFIYIDEAQDYFDQNIEHLLNQARKYRLGMTFAHQNLDQLSAGLRASVLASTSTKFAGGVSAKDANVFASEMRCDPDFVQSMRKRATQTEFACFVRNLTSQAIPVLVPLGFAEQLPTLTDAQYEVLIAANRARYCAPASEIEVLYERSAPAPPVVKPPKQRPTERAPSPPTPAAPGTPTPTVEPTRPAEEVVAPRVEPEARKAEAKPTQRRGPQVPAEPAPLGAGGRQHKYVQQLLTQAAQERGFRATIEEPILDGAGRVDISLEAGGRRIACEISVTTTRDQELGNIEKCLDAGYDEVFLISSQKRHVAGLKKFIVPELEESERDKIRFLTVDEFLAFLDEASASPGTTEGTVRGYRVRVTRKMVSEEEAKARREAINQVIAKSLRQMKE